MRRLLIRLGLLALTLIPAGGMAARHAKPRPKLGAFAAPVHFTVQAGGASYVFDSSAITFTPAGSEAKRALSGTGTFVLVGPGPTPSPTPTPTPNPSPPPVPGPTPTPLPVPTPGPTPAPVPPGALNVRNYGVKGDGVTSDVTALNALIRSAPSGAVLYFPAGTYILDDALKVFRSNLAFIGDGDASILKSVAGSYHVQIGSGQAYTGLSFRSMQFYGTPGQYMADGTARGGVLNFGSKGTVFEDCLFRGCAEPILDAGQPMTTSGTIINRCRIFGHGRMAIFANGGEQITNCKIIQDDPNLFGERSSHGVYVHGGASNVLIADCTFQNIRKYCIQAYSESIPSTTDNLQIRRCLFRDSENGVITAHGNATAGILTNSVIDGCTFQNIYGGQGIAIKNGQGLAVTNNTISDGVGAGISLGVFAPYEPNYNLSNVQVTGNTVRRCDRGIWALNSNGGTFTNCTVTGNLVSGLGNHRDYDITGPGIAWAPGRAPTAGRSVDTKPSDDRSRAGKSP